MEKSLKECYDELDKIADETFKKNLKKIFKDNVDKKNIIKSPKKTDSFTDCLDKISTTLSKMIDIVSENKRKQNVVNK